MIARFFYEYFFDNQKFVKANRIKRSMLLSALKAFPPFAGQENEQASAS